MYNKIYKLVYFQLFFMFFFSENINILASQASENEIFKFSPFHITQIPQETLICTFSNLDQNNLLRLGHVNLLFRSITYEVWKTRILDLSGRPRTLEDLQMIVYGKFSMINLSNASINSQDMTCFYNNPSITYMDLSWNNNIGDEKAEQLSLMLNKNLKTLKLIGCGISNPILITLRKQYPLRKKNTSKKLYLYQIDEYYV